MPPDSRIRASRAAYLVLLIAFTANPAEAQKAILPTISVQPGGCIINVPSQSTYSQRSGLRLQVDSCWPFSHGYRPVRIHVTSDKPTTTEQRITVRFHIAAWESHYLDVSQSFDMPLGATEASAIIRCPQLQSDYRYWWDVWVDGVREKDLRFTESESWSLNASGNTNPVGTGSKFLIIGPPSKRRQMMNAGADAFQAITLTAADLPTRWIDLSAVDVVVLAPDDLKTLAQTRPEVLTALGRWVRTGGQLWMHPLGENWERLPDVERLLSLTPPTAAKAAAIAATDPDQAAAARGWKPVVFRNNPERGRITVQHIPSGQFQIVRDAATLEQLRRDPNYSIIEDPPSPAETAPAPTPPHWIDSAKWYLERDAGLGHIRAFRRAWDPVGFGISFQMLAGGGPGAVVPTTPVTATVETTRNWRSRHGMAPDVANEDFADFLIPGVGLAPVTEFRLLISVFVLVIGPLNFWLLMRANRLHLVLFTVPLLALGLTGALFAYALLSDGLSTSVRVRSFTSLDQTTGEAACWARLSYYSGLAPSRGLELPADVALYPILPGWNEIGDSGSNSITRKMEWRGNKQQFTSGWLRSRVPTQFLSVRARKSPHRLRFAPTAEKLVATNELGTPITFVAAVDPAGNVFVGDSIAERATVTLNPSTHVAALGRLRELVATNQPETPPALAESDRYQSRSRRRRRQLFADRSDVDYSVERLSENLLSEAIASLVATSDEPLLNIPPGSYVAITEIGPEVELGLADVDEQASFHVVVGNWSGTPSP